ncbi:hypothetical protein BTO05_09530 [Winogradskyella sp. PC-19]|uniref:DUF1800 domain-containing protein n=1 Tax=unclassified Winogradskyella TaxID=2615021 RepID=UPI000B3D4E72|nr:MULTISPECIES: DUF1800 domain-containing protein [unclassified Winogradskyella]ARV09870.1 hypothetical protein BTO05_09530 [Winogradskyella sp. PC-19]RZN82346.1 MAG: DUF1800 domain-containing protein [Winogradskyella sp.]
MKQEHIKHLYWRAGFGVKPIDLVEKSNISRREVIDGLFRASQEWEPLKIDLTEFENIDFKTLKRNPKLAKEIRQKSRKRILDLNIAWIDKLVLSENVLRERMTLFWANHFVCGDKNVVHIQQYNNTLRLHALGDFRTFVKAISKEVAMIKYLNLRQNKKAEPNENFARELMELFTLGRGNYTEKDIKESARAFTGYSQNFKGEYIFRKFLHDYGQKVFLGKTGNFNGDDIIDIILEQRQCAKFICNKVYSYFVNETTNEFHVESMTDVFYKDYNIEKLMRFVFTQDWFYDAKNMGSKIKSPIDFLVGLSKTVPVKYNNRKALIKLQKLLGQTLFDPPNVAGWKGHKTWIDANTIMVRLKLASILLNGGMIALDDEKDQMRRQFFEKNKRKLPIKTTPDWYTFLSEYKTIPSEDLSSVLLSGIINKGTQSHIESMNKSSKQKFCIQLMSLPEYQMY